MYVEIYLVLFQNTVCKPLRFGLVYIAKQKKLKVFKVSRLVNERGNDFILCITEIKLIRLQKKLKDTDED